MGAWTVFLCLITLATKSHSITTPFNPVDNNRLFSSVFKSELIAYDSSQCKFLKGQFLLPAIVINCDHEATFQISMLQLDLATASN
jgi:hypothetical protein